MKKRKKPFINSLFDKEKLTEEDLIALDKIWVQFLKYKTSKFDEINNQNQQNKKYVVETKKDSFIYNDDNIDIAIDRAKDYSNYMNSISNFYHFYEK